MPPPPVSGAAVGYGVVTGTVVRAGAGVGRWLAGVALAVGVALSDGLGVDVAVPDALAVDVAVPDALGFDVAVPDALADALAVGVAFGVAVLRPTVGVLTGPVVWDGDRVGGCGVKIDGATDEDGEPPVQAATVIAMSTAPAVARAAMIRRTFMKPPGARGGQ